MARSWQGVVLDDTVKVKVRLRDPYYTNNSTGAVTPMTDSFPWAEVPLVEEERFCQHGVTVCADCIDSWHIDHLIRLQMNNQIVWRSEDDPDQYDRS